MKKGVSPIVAEVLLIAIVVSTTMGIWYWMGQYQSIPIPELDLIEVSITGCNGSHVLARTVGRETADEAADIYEKDVGIVGFINFNGTTVKTGNISYVDIINTSKVLPFNGTFFIIDQDYEQYTFVC